MAKIELKQNIELDEKTIEAFRLFRTNIEYAESEVKAITFLSAYKGEGTSFISLYTAISLAEIGKKCLYLNANMRDENHADIYSIEGSYNTLSSYLEGKCKKEDIVYQTNINGLDIIDSKQCNKVELFTGECYSVLIKSLKNEYDYVLIDAPPLLEVSDSISSAYLCDGVILIMETCRVPYDKAIRVMSILKRNNCKILGTVLNKKLQLSDIISKDIQMYYMFALLIGGYIENYTDWILNKVYYEGNI